MTVSANRYENEFGRSGAIGIIWRGGYGRKGGRVALLSV